MDAKQALRQFLAERTALHISAFAKECGLDRMNFTKILLGGRSMPQPKRAAVFAAMKKYGFVEVVPLHQKNTSPLVGESPEY